MAENTGKQGLLRKGGSRRLTKRRPVKAPRGGAALPGKSRKEGLWGPSPVLEPGACGSQHPMTLTEFGDWVETVEALIDDRRFAADVTGPNCCEVATFIYSKGDTEARAEALLALVPIADRLLARLREVARCMKDWEDVKEIEAQRDKQAAQS